MKLIKYKTDTSEYTYYMEDGIKIRHGICRAWFEIDQLEYEKNYQDGKLHGLQREWYFNGQLGLEYNYKDGDLHGPCREWYRSGQLESEFYYQEGTEYESEGAYREALIANKVW